MSHCLHDKVISITKVIDLVYNFYAALSTYSGTQQNKIRNCTFTNFQIDKDKFKKKHILYEFL
ncbi:hypothetical protein PVIIG_06066 [Plasmodium vivax India VII]|uniref:Uncharacterized protein n=1 Tax=Plasmodium vivax India VII TaxID=1077284 RepID=A0A0J9S336_PLAVI|nr:hypothetical protein PVIIG_06066 [Plasmodium vivax India VII]